MAGRPNYTHSVIPPRTFLLKAKNICDMLREAPQSSPLVSDGHDDFPEERAETIARWIDVFDDPDQLRMLHKMRDRISVSEFNATFERERSNYHYDLGNDLRQNGLAVKISNSDLQPESADDYFKKSRNGDDDWYHLTSLGLEFLRSITDPEGPPLLAPASIADDLKGFIRGVPGESRRIDEHLVRTDAYETEAEFNSFRAEVAAGQYEGSLAPPVVPTNPYLISREMDITVYEGESTLRGQRDLDQKITTAIRGRAQVRLFGPWAPTTSANVFETPLDLPGTSHRFIAGRGFIDKMNSDEQTGSMETFLDEACERSDIQVESTQRYLPYVLGILQNEDGGETELFVWGRGNPETDSYMMFATATDPSPALYNWATDLYEYVADSATEFAR